VIHWFCTPDELRKERAALHKLVQWKNAPNRKPLIIQGARQVGKTWLMRHFGDSFFPQTAYINFEKNPRMLNLFQDDLDIERILVGLQIEAGVPVTTETLLVLDEVQEVPQALTSLKYFHENRPDLPVLAAGSLLGVAMHHGASFPVGKTSFLTLHPLSFAEFLKASGNGDLLDQLLSQDFSLIHTFQSKIVDLLKQYMFTGGMPEVVETLLQSGNVDTVRSVQKNLLAAYEQDFSKHAPAELVPRIRLLWHSLPAQLARENRKFIFGLVREGARAREFELALQWLLDSGLLHQVFRAAKPALPLKAYRDLKAFKLFMVDVGLLGALSGLEPVVLLQGNRIFQEFKGALTEQYVLQQLLAGEVDEPCYWSAGKGTAEVDFLIQREGEIYPVEVKAAENLRAKSLQSYAKQFSPGKAVRISMSDYRDQDWLVNVPLYAVNQIGDLLSR